ncbi:MAG TPA: growth inhibitor PemK [Caulobacteraceae bacterium]
MSWPKPEPGLVVRYSYLCSREAALGREEGSKDRPCAIILAARQGEGDFVYVLPVTHSPPQSPGDAIEIPPATKARLGLDTERSWVVLTETNAFVWPGPDLRFLPGGGPETLAYGMLPPAFFREVRDRFVAGVRARRSRVTRRTE